MQDDKHGAFEVALARGAERGKPLLAVFAEVPG
jgi:hypothetical protein